MNAQAKKKSLTYDSSPVDSVGKIIDSNARERDWKRDHVRPLATIESQEIILATDRFLLWKLFLPAEAILGRVFNFLWNKTLLLKGTRVQVH